MIRKNILFNLIGKFWSIFSIFFFIPIYIKYLGFESYSLISFTLIIAGFLAFLDGGLTATLSREFARKDNSLNKKKQIFKTIESSYLLIISLCIIIVFGLSDFISNSWLKLDNLNSNDVSYFIKIISFGIGFEMLFRLYTGGLFGLEDQVKANIYLIAWGLVRNGLVIVLIFFIPRLEAFFLWQTIVTLLFAIVLRFVCYQSLTGFYELYSVNFNINKKILKSIIRFTGGMFVISLISSINSQLDKIIISTNLTIITLGYYTLATSLSMVVFVIVNPISIAYLPRFTSLYSENKYQEAELLFKKINSIISVISLSIMANIVLFSEELLWIWTGDKTIAIEASTYLPIIAVAFTMLSLQVFPFNIAIANGYTKLNTTIGIISLIITVPGYWFGIKFFGGIGAASVFCILMIFQTLIYIYFIKIKFLKSLSLKSLFVDQLLFPLVISFATAFVFFLVDFDISNGRILSLLWVGFSSLTTILISASILLPVKEIIKNKYI